MIKEPKIVRLNIRVSKKIDNYFVEKSEETGVAKSSLMALALEEYIDQKKMLNFTTDGGFQGLLQQVEEKQNQLNVSGKEVN